MNVAIFGGTGGLGKQLVEKLESDYTVFALGSKDVDVTNFLEVKNFFLGNVVDIVVNLSGYNYNSFLHKYSEDNLTNRQKQIDVTVNGSLNILTKKTKEVKQTKVLEKIRKMSFLTSINA